MRAKAAHGIVSVADENLRHSRLWRSARRAHYARATGIQKVDCSLLGGQIRLMAGPDDDDVGGTAIRYRAGRVTARRNARSQAPASDRDGKPLVFQLTAPQVARRDDRARLLRRPREGRLRVHLPQFFVAKAVLLRRAGPEILPEDVRPRDQACGGFRALPRFSGSM